MHFNFVYIALSNQTANIMSFLRNKHICSLKGSETVYFLKGFALKEIGCFQIPEGSLLYVPDNTHDINTFSDLHQLIFHRSMTTESADDERYFCHPSNSHAVRSMLLLTSLNRNILLVNTSLLQNRSSVKIPVIISPIM